MTSQWQPTTTSINRYSKNAAYTRVAHTFLQWPLNYDLDFLSFLQAHNLPAAKTTASKHWRQDLVTENNTDQPHYSTVTSIHLTINELISHLMLHQTTPEKICYHCTNKLNTMTATKSRRVIHYWNKHAESSNLRALYLQKIHNADGNLCCALKIQVGLPDFLRRNTGDFCPSVHPCSPC